ncbi:hypothetical protein EHI2019_001065800 [Entamoeba histolytica]
MNTKPIRMSTSESNTIHRKPARPIRSSQSMVSDTDSSESINYPKTIEVMNFVYFNLNGQLDIGVSCHASFNYDSPENDQMICFSTYGNMTPKHFNINKNITRIEIWFKDYKGKSIFPVGLWMNILS